MFDEVVRWPEYMKKLLHRNKNSAPQTEKKTGKLRKEAPARVAANEENFASLDLFIRSIFQPRLVHNDCFILYSTRNKQRLSSSLLNNNIFRRYALFLFHIFTLRAHTKHVYSAHSLRYEVGKIGICLFSLLVCLIRRFRLSMPTYSTIPISLFLFFRKVTFSVDCLHHTYHFACIYPLLLLLLLPLLRTWNNK